MLVLTGAAALFILRSMRRRGRGIDAAPLESSNPPAASAQANDEISPAVRRRRAAAASAADRLWRQVFEARERPTEMPATLPARHRAVRASVIETLEAETLGERYFPRRPTLMPQLLHAVNDPEAGPARLAAIVAQDPVLTGDVVRLANSAFYRVTPQPVETIQRAIVVCGSDGLQSLIATALMQPVFRGTHGAFGRFPTVLWERTSQAAVAAETYALLERRGDRLLAQLTCLLGALGPLVIYRAGIEAYAESPELRPNPELFLGLIETLGAETARRVARQWNLPARVVAALGVRAGDPATEEMLALAEAVDCGELFGTLCTMERERLLEPDEARRLALETGISAESLDEIWKRMRSSRR